MQKRQIQLYKNKKNLMKRHTIPLKSSLTIGLLGLTITFVTSLNRGRFGAFGSSSSVWYPLKRNNLSIHTLHISYSRNALQHSITPRNALIVVSTNMLFVAAICSLCTNKMLIVATRNVYCCTKNMLIVAPKDVLCCTNEYSCCCTVKNIVIVALDIFVPSIL